MSGLFPDEKFRNKSADRPWKKSETDKMLDMYFSGAHPKRIAHSLGRNPKAVKRRLEQFTYNERDRAFKYEPFRRASRRGKRLTENERVMIRTYREKKLSMEMLAKVLQRGIEEINPDYEGKPKHVEMKAVATGTDLVQAYQYAFHCSGIRVVSDKVYDDLKAEEMEYGGGYSILKKPASKKVAEYPTHVRSLAHYLMVKSKKWDDGKDER